MSLQDWEAVEYCTALICASLIHLKPLAKIIASSILGPIRSTSPPNGTSECRTPAYLLNARASSRYGALEVDQHVGSVISALWPTKGIKPNVTFRDGIDVGTDVLGRVSYKELLQSPQKAFLRG